MTLETREHDPGDRAVAVIEGEFAEIATIKRAPADILEDGRKVAEALNGVIAKKTDKVMMNNEQYLEFEDWSLIATFFGKGVSTPPEETRFIDLGIVEIEPNKPVHIYGFEATAHLIDIRTGRDLFSATMTCLTDEPKWRSKNKYEYMDAKDAPAGSEIVWRGYGKDNTPRVKVKTGEDPVPLFQLRSMAQTRAGSKVCRMNYSWVAVLAGFPPTPAEEIEGGAAPGVPVDDADLKIISESWRALVAKKDEIGKAKVASVKDALRSLGYKGRTTKDLWADFASRGKDDVLPVKIALGLVEPPKEVIDFEDETATHPAPAPTAQPGKESLFPEDKR